MATKNAPKPRFNVLNFVIQWEAGECSPEEEVEGFQHLINNGMAWTLQGCYGRRAQELIASGDCSA